MTPQLFIKYNAKLYFFGSKIGSIANSALNGLKKGIWVSKPQSGETSVGN